MGTTSFRTADFNQKIERQLTLLSKFWEVHTDAVWSGNDEIQSLYYDFMKDNDFLTGDAPNKPKDAREKTSGFAKRESTAKVVNTTAHTTRSTALSSHWIKTTHNPFSICYRPAGIFASARCGATTFSKRRTGEK